MQAPAIYREWWTKTESCSGLKGNVDRVRWWFIKGSSFSCHDGQCVGYWKGNSHHIFLAGDFVNNEMVVRHEMLHDLRGRAGHPNPPFGGTCPLTWESWDKFQKGEKY